MELATVYTQIYPLVLTWIWSKFHFVGAAKKKFCSFLKTDSFISIKVQLPRFVFKKQNLITPNSEIVKTIIAKTRSLLWTTVVKSWLCGLWNNLSQLLNIVHNIPLLNIVHAYDCVKDVKTFCVQTVLFLCFHVNKCQKFIF